MAANEGEKKLAAEDIEKDNRDVADLWKDALKQYKGIVGFDLQPKFNNVQAMVDFGTGEMNAFHKFRHNSKKVDKLRSLFAANIDYIEKGAQQLISAATPAFPPAAAIGTAITYLLSVRLIFILAATAYSNRIFKLTIDVFFFRLVNKFQLIMMLLLCSLKT